VSERLVPLGEIVTTHGIEGWLKLKPYNPDSAIFSSAQKVFLERGEVCSTHFLEASRIHKNRFLLKLRAIDSIEEAKKWVGWVLSVGEDQLQALNPGEYYYYQALGLDVFDLEGRWVGVVTQVWPKEGGDLYVVTAASKDYLIPAVKAVVEKVDLRERKMIINPPAGLLDL
jgi:16S rRNA processing protein RimM